MSQFFLFSFLIWLWLPISLCFSAAAPFKVESARIEPADSNGGRHGQLIFLGGFELASKDSRFGGLSGLALTKDGKRLYAISDRGYWLTARLHHDGQGVLQRLDSWQMAHWRFFCSFHEPPPARGDSRRTRQARRDALQR